MNVGAQVANKSWTYDIWIQKEVLCIHLICIVIYILILIMSITSIIIVIVIIVIVSIIIIHNHRYYPIFMTITFGPRMSLE